METIQSLLTEAQSAIHGTHSTTELNGVESYYLGRKGPLQELMKQISSLPSDQKPLFGQQINQAREQLAQWVSERREQLRGSELTAQLQQERIDPTLPGLPQPNATLHPLTLTAKRVKATLIGLGFEFVEGPELEEFRYNFDALNYPEDHPAMDEQNSFHVREGWLMRTQMTALQGRTYERRKPPMRMATIGRCFRKENVDATHHHTFHQVDAFMVDEGISMAHLKGTITLFARQMFGADVRVRFRPDFFPFVEPGVDFSISWKGGWLELGGAGLIHPTILRKYGIDTERYSGFAFGFGIERIPMLQYGVDDLRLFLENDLRFLKQFTTE